MSSKAQKQMAQSFRMILAETVEFHCQVKIQNCRVQL